MNKNTDLAFTYVVISLFSAAFWFMVCWFLYRPFALLVGLVAFVVTLAGLSFNYGAHAGEQ